GGPPLVRPRPEPPGLPPPALGPLHPPPLPPALSPETPAPPIEQRLTAAETAAAAGVLSSEHLAAAYAVEPVQSAKLDTALDLPDIGATPETRAVLYQAAQHASAPQQRARFIQKALATDALDANYWARLQIYLPLLADIAPAPELTGVAADAARHLYAGGKLREAGAWVTLIQQGQQANPDAAAALPELQALGDLAGNTAPLAPGTAPQPFMPKLAPDDPRAARLRALFNVLQQAQETSPTEPQV